MRTNSNTVMMRSASAAAWTGRSSCCPKAADYYSLYEQRNETNLGEIINMALDAIEEANKEKLEGVFRNIGFNSEAALGQTKQRNAAPEKPAGRFPRPAPGYAPQPHQRAGRDRQCLRVPDRQVCGHGGQEGGRVLHAAGSLAPAGQAAGPPTGRPDLRSRPAAPARC